MLRPTRPGPLPTSEKEGDLGRGNPASSLAPFPPAARRGWTVNRTRHLSRSPRSLSPGGSPDHVFELDVSPAVRFSEIHS